MYPLTSGFLGRVIGSRGDSTEVYCPEERSIGDDKPALAAVYVKILVFQNHKLLKKSPVLLQKIIGIYFVFLYLFFKV